MHPMSSRAGQCSPRRTHIPPEQSAGWCLTSGSSSQSRRSQTIASTASQTISSGQCAPDDQSASLRICKRAASLVHQSVQAGFLIHIAFMATMAMSAISKVAMGILDNMVTCIKQAQKHWPKPHLLLAWSNMLGGVCNEKTLKEQSIR